MEKKDECAKEMNFDVKKIGRPRTRDNSMTKLPNSPAIMISGISINFLLSNPNELSNRLKLLLQEKQAGDISEIFNNEIIVIVGKLLENKCISNKNKF